MNAALARWFRRQVGLVVWLAGLGLLLLPACRGAGLLGNPGFESDGRGESQNLPGWNAYGGNNYTETSAAVAHSGTNYFKVYQAFNGQVNYTGVYQDYLAGPGAVYAADGWACTTNSDKIAGQNAAWLEVTFRDASANILALYRSLLITTNGLATGAFPVNKWVDLAVTNQYNPVTQILTNTVRQLVAPAGTYFVRYQVVFAGDAHNSLGSVYFDDLTLSRVGGSPYGSYNIVWSDEFNGTSLNPAVWTYDTGNNNGWGNSELENYTSRTNNALVTGGYLHVMAQKESLGSSGYSSARIKSQGLFSLQYGRLEWRAQLPPGVGFWPALWLLGTNINTIGWPNCGEIDVMENNGGVLGTVQGSLHSGSDETGYFNFLPGDSVTNFHTYTLDWTTNAILYYVDGHLYQTQTSWASSSGAYPFPFNQPFFIIMNLAVGGNYLGNPSTSTINSGSTFPGIMAVDYVRLYRPTAPLLLALTRTNSAVLLTWPTNIVCHLQGQTNATNGALGTNWTDLTQYTNSARLAPTNRGAYYRLVSP